MTSAVHDTNVLASGFRGVRNPQSTPGQLIRAWLAGRYQFVVSEHILAELRRTFQRPYFLRHLTPGQIADALRALAEEATVTPLSVSVSGIATHPEDDLVLATALSAQADYLVTGDGKLQRLGAHDGVVIVSPRQFLPLLDEGAF